MHEWETKVKREGCLDAAGGKEAETPPTGGESRNETNARRGHRFNPRPWDSLFGLNRSHCMNDKTSIKKYLITFLFFCSEGLSSR